MAEPSDNLVLEHLRYMRGRLDFIVEEMQGMNRRVILTEQSVANLFAGGAGAQDEIERLKSRVARIERRLDMVER
jgi:hypothetical protein